MAIYLSPERARRLAYALIKLWTKPLSEADLRAPAIVFAPHEDDETLACGGTILKKRRLGAQVHVVFLTDGTLSPRTTPAHELKPRREREARAACQTLGVEPDHVTFFGYRDGQLLDQIEPATERVSRFLAEHPAEQIFMPYFQDRDPGLDHMAANQIIQAAVRRTEQKPVLYEYPTWYWRFWPQIRMPIRGQPRQWTTLSSSLWPSLRPLTDFGRCVPIDDVLDLKRAALEQHQTQVGGLDRIQSGAFVKWFFDGREIFYRHTGVHNRQSTLVIGLF